MEKEKAALTKSNGLVENENDTVKDTNVSNNVTNDETKSTFIRAKDLQFNLASKFQSQILLIIFITFIK